MTQPTTAREALILEALGDAARLIRQVEALGPRLDESRREFVDAHARLVSQMAAFDANVGAAAEKVRTEAVRHILARTEEAARRSIEHQARAMAGAAHAAFGAELDTAMLRIVAAVRAVADRPGQRRDAWLTHAAAAATSAALTWALAIHLWGG